MKSKLIHALASLVVFAALSGAIVGLAWRPRAQAEPAAEHITGDECCPPTEAGHAEAAEHAHAEHGAAAGQPDLAELLETRCEHEVSIVDCDECRYEAGVARIEPNVARGLVEAQPVRTEPRATKRLHLTGEVQFDPTRVVEIASAGGGRVEQVHKVLGDRVEPSEVLAVIQSSELGAVQAAFLEARARLDLATRTHQREKQLHEQKISSQADYLAAGHELAAAEAAVVTARKRLELFGFSGAQIEAFAGAPADAAFGQLTLTAPIRGTIIEQDVVRGRLVDTSDTLYRIADLSRVWVWCDVYEADLATLHERIASGKPVPAEIRATAFPQTAFRGTIDMLGSELDRQTRTLKVRVTADNPGGRLKPGMFVRASIDLDGTETVLRVPETAVLSDAGRNFVFTRLNDELWLRRDVTVGPTADGLMEIHAGLNDGDVVAAKGAFMFKSEILKEKMGAGCAH